MPNADPARSHLAIWRHGCSVAATTSVSDRPRARASTNVRSRIETINWSRTRADRSFMKNKAMMKTAMAERPEMMNWLCQSTKWLSVWVATILVIRLPATGPTVQNPMAEARPSCGLKSRTIAGVATKMAPSTRPRAEMTMPKASSDPALGTPTQTSSPTMSSP